MTSNFLIFPGQGAQAVGMGAELAQANEIAAQTFADADVALGFKLSEICFAGPAEALTATEIAQPALLAHSIAVLRVASSLRPDFHSTILGAAGHSLGEWTALVAAGALRFEDALRLVHLRGKLMQAACPLGVGQMAAIVGLSDAEVEDICTASASGEVVVPATYNGRGNVVIAGHRAAVERAVALAKERGAIQSITLDVSAPFHCPLMSPAEPELARALAETEIRPPSIPVCSSVDGAWMTDPATIVANLNRQLVEPVRWELCLQEAVRRGTQTFLVLGAGSAMSRMIGRMRLGPRTELWQRGDESVG